MKEYKRLKNPIIFIGTGRSGTTIISEMVSRHRDLAYVSNYSEKSPSNVSVNVARRLFDNRFYRIFGQKKQLNKVSLINKFAFKPSEAYRMWEYLSGNEINFSRDFLIDKPITEERIDFIRSYFDSMVKFQNRKRLVFKITGPSRITYLSKIFPDAIFIHLKRSYIPTIASFLKIDFWKTRGAHKLWWTGVYSDEEKKWVSENANNEALVTAFQLKKLNDIAELEVKKVQPNYLEVHYEQFVQDPEEEINRIIEFTALASFDVKKQLEDIKIFNRNKKDSEYFNESDLKEIYKILEG
ncbi:MAG: sulfotransferase [Flavobacteriaceae bacterium]|nr:sulfotransferase [Bacteroidia bacterium]NNF75497.1 sulfotransferase [Flavobacteriaceae bacterium]